MLDKLTPYSKMILVACFLTALFGLLDRFGFLQAIADDPFSTESIITIILIILAIVIIQKSAFHQTKK